MAPRLLPLAVVVAAIAADAGDLHGPAFYLLVGGVAVSAISALSIFGELVELPPRSAGQSYGWLEVLLSGLGLVCMLVSAAARGHAGDAVGPPPPAVSALFAALALFGLQAFMALYRPPQRATERD
jgi:hypothetical protein